MGSVVAWVTWVRDLCGSLGVWVAYVKFLRGLRGSNIFAWVNFFCVGQLLFTRRDYFTILQLIV